MNYVQTASNRSIWSMVIHIHIHAEITLEKSAAKGCLLCRVLFQVFCVGLLRDIERADLLCVEVGAGGLFEEGETRGRDIEVVIVTDYNKPTQTFKFDAVTACCIVCF